MCLKDKSYMMRKVTNIILKSVLVASLLARQNLSAWTRTRQSYDLCKSTCAHAHASPYLVLNQKLLDTKFFINSNRRSFLCTILSRFSCFFQWLTPLIGPFSKAKETLTKPKQEFSSPRLFFYLTHQHSIPDLRKTTKIIY